MEIFRLLRMWWPRPITEVSFSHFRRLTSNTTPSRSHNQAPVNSSLSLFSYEIECSSIGSRRLHASFIRDAAFSSRKIGVTLCNDCHKCHVDIMPCLCYFFTGLVFIFDLESFLFRHCLIWIPLRGFFISYPSTAYRFSFLQSKTTFYGVEP